MLIRMKEKSLCLSIQDVKETTVYGFNFMKRISV